MTKSSNQFFITVMITNIFNTFRKISIVVFLFINTIVFLLVPIGIQAQSQCQIYNPNTPNFGPNCIPLLKNFQGNKEGISGVIIKVADYAIFILGALGVLMIVYAGFLIITDGGSGERSGKGRKIFFNVIFGIILAIASYTIVTFVSGFVSTIDITNLNSRPSATNNTIQ